MLQILILNNQCFFYIFNEIYINCFKKNLKFKIFDRQENM